MSFYQQYSILALHFYNKIIIMIKQIKCVIFEYRSYFFTYNYKTLTFNYVTINSKQFIIIMTIYSYLFLNYYSKMVTRSYGDYKPVDTQNKRFASKK